MLDNGLLCYREGDQVMAVLAENMGIRGIRVDADQGFLDELDAALIETLR